MLHIRGMADMDRRQIQMLFRTFDNGNSGITICVEKLYGAVMYTNMFFSSETLSVLQPGKTYKPWENIGGNKVV